MCLEETVRDERKPFITIYSRLDMLDLACYTQGDRALVSSK